MELQIPESSGLPCLSGKRTAVGDKGLSDIPNRCCIRQPVEILSSGVTHVLMRNYAWC